MNTSTISQIRTAYTSEPSDGCVLMTGSMLLPGDMIYVTMMSTNFDRFMALVLSVDKNPYSSMFGAIIACHEGIRYVHYDDFIWKFL